MSNNIIEQKVIVRITDDEDIVWGYLTLSTSVNSKKFLNIPKKSLEPFSKPHMDFINVPSGNRSENIYSQIPIVYNEDVPDNSTSRLLLLEETQYEVVFDPEKGMIIADDFEFFPTIKKENLRDITFQPWILLKEKNIIGGNLNFHSYVGKSFFDLNLDGEKCKPHPFDVRSKKIGYHKQYPKMLEDLSNAATGLLFEPTAPLYQHFTLIDKHRIDPYQHFMFLEYVFSSENLPQIMSFIKKNLHNKLIIKKEPTPIEYSYGINSGNLIDMVTDPNNIQKSTMCPPNWPEELHKFVPINIHQHNIYETIDTPENRLVKHLLVSLELLIKKVRTSLDKSDNNQFINRRLIDYYKEIEMWLMEDWMYNISELKYVPMNSQVLQKKEGYRQIFQLFLTFEFAVNFQWEEIDELLIGYNKKLSELYEYWCYIKLIQVLENLSDNQIKMDDIFEFNKKTLKMNFKRGNASVQKFIIQHNGIKINVSLMYNKRFSRKTKLPSYSLPFRPDYSLLFNNGDDAFFIHFDAKYRSEGKVIEFYDTIGKEKILKSDVVAIDEEELNNEKEDEYDEEINIRDNKEEKFRKYKDGDIYKMHTYKDAILSTKGAYILYPGDMTALFRENDNWDIPSVGAYPLTPSGNEKEMDSLKIFIIKIIEKHFSEWCLA